MSDARTARNACKAILRKSYDRDKLHATNRNGSRKYRQRHPQRIRARTWITYRRDHLMDVLGRICVVCKTVANLTIDHINSPVDNSITNLQVLCRRCNSRKGAR